MQMPSLKNCLLPLLFTIPLVANAAAPSWQIVPTESTLTFTATQNDAPIEGKFKSFTGDINFDPNQLDQSHVKISVDISSLNDAYNQLADTLKAADWFNTKVFPQAIFQSDKFVKTGAKTFQAVGKLTIRDKTLPVTLDFTEEEFSATKARMTGSTTIKRTAFGVGQGEWMNTKNVKDDVRIDFTVTGIKK